MTFFKSNYFQKSTFPKIVITHLFKKPDDRRRKRKRNRRTTMLSLLFCKKKRDGYNVKEATILPGQNSISQV